MARVYSTRFIFAALAEDETATYTVPDGFTAVVRDLTAAQVSSGAGSVVSWQAFADGIDGLAIAYMALPGDNSSAHLELRLVLVAEDQLIVINQNEPEAHVTASGYLLTLP